MPANTEDVLCVESVEDGGETETAEGGESSAQSTEVSCAESTAEQSESEQLEFNDESTTESDGDGEGVAATTTGSEGSDSEVKSGASEVVNKTATGVSANSFAEWGGFGNQTIQVRSEESDGGLEEFNAADQTVIPVYGKEKEGSSDAVGGTSILPRRRVALPFDTNQWEATRALTGVPAVEQASATSKSNPELDEAVKNYGVNPLISLHLTPEKGKGVEKKELFKDSGPNTTKGAAVVPEDLSKVKGPPGFSTASGTESDTSAKRRSKIPVKKNSPTRKSSPKNKKWKPQAKTAEEKKIMFEEEAAKKENVEKIRQAQREKRSEKKPPVVPGAVTRNAAKKKEEDLVKEFDGVISRAKLKAPLTTSMSQNRMGVKTKATEGDGPLLTTLQQCATSTPLPKSKLAEKRKEAKQDGGATGHKKCGEAPGIERKVVKQMVKEFSKESRKDWQNHFTNHRRNEYEKTRIQGHAPESESKVWRKACERKRLYQTRAQQFRKSAGAYVIGMGAVSSGKVRDANYTPESLHNHVFTRGEMPEGGPQIAQIPYSSENVGEGLLTSEKFRLWLEYSKRERSQWDDDHKKRHARIRRRPRPAGKRDPRLCFTVVTRSQQGLLCCKTCDEGEKLPIVTWGDMQFGVINGRLICARCSQARHTSCCDVTTSGQDAVQPRSFVCEDCTEWAEANRDEYIKLQVANFGVDADWWQPLGEPQDLPSYQFGSDFDFVTTDEEEDKIEEESLVKDKVLENGKDEEKDVQSRAQEEQREKELPSKKSKNDAQESASASKVQTAQLRKQKEQDDEERIKRMRQEAGLQDVRRADPVITKQWLVKEEESNEVMYIELLDADGVTSYSRRPFMNLDEQAVKLVLTQLVIKDPAIPEELGRCAQQKICERMGYRKGMAYINQMLTFAKDMAWAQSTGAAGKPEGTKMPQAKPSKQQQKQAASPKSQRKGKGVDKGMRSAEQEEESRQREQNRPGSARSYYQYEKRGQSDYESSSSEGESADRGRDQSSQDEETHARWEPIPSTRMTSTQGRRGNPPDDPGDSSSSSSKSSGTLSPVNSQDESIRRKVKQKQKRRKRRHAKAGDAVERMLKLQREGQRETMEHAQRMFELSQEQATNASNVSKNKSQSYDNSAPKVQSVKIKFDQLDLENLHLIEAIVTLQRWLTSAVKTWQLAFKQYPESFVVNQLMQCISSNTLRRQLQLRFAELDITGYTLAWLDDAIRDIWFTQLNAPDTVRNHLLHKFKQGPTKSIQEWSSIMRAAHAVLAQKNHAPDFNETGVKIVIYQQIREEIRNEMMYRNGARYKTFEALVKDAYDSEQILKADPKSYNENYVKTNPSTRDPSKKYDPTRQFNYGVREESAEEEKEKTEEKAKKSSKNGTEEEKSFLAETRQALLAEAEELVSKKTNKLTATIKAQEKKHKAHEFEVRAAKERLQAIEEERQERARDSSQVTCRGCGELGHYLDQCTNNGMKNIDCYECGEMGHIARDCNQRKPNSGQTRGGRVNQGGRARGFRGGNRGGGARGGSRGGQSGGMVGGKTGGTQGAAVGTAASTLNPEAPVFPPPNVLHPSSVQAQMVQAPPTYMPPMQMIPPLMQSYPDYYRQIEQMNVWKQQQAAQAVQAAVAAQQAYQLPQALAIPAGVVLPSMVQPTGATVVGSLADPVAMQSAAAISGGGASISEAAMNHARQLWSSSDQQTLAELARMQQTMPAAPAAAAVVTSVPAQSVNACVASRQQLQESIAMQRQEAKRLDNQQTVNCSWGGRETFNMITGVGEPCPSKAGGSESTGKTKTKKKQKAKQELQSVKPRVDRLSEKRVEAIGQAINAAMAIEQEFGNVQVKPVYTYRARVDDDMNMPYSRLCAFDYVTYAREQAIREEEEGLQRAAVAQEKELENSVQSNKFSVLTSPQKVQRLVEDLRLLHEDLHKLCKARYMGEVLRERKLAENPKVRSAEGLDREEVEGRISRLDYGIQQLTRDILDYEFLLAKEVESLFPTPLLSILDAEERVKQDFPDVGDYLRDQASTHRIHLLAMMMVVSRVRFYGEFMSEEEKKVAGFESIVPYSQPPVTFDPRAERQTHILLLVREWCKLELRRLTLRDVIEAGQESNPKYAFRAILDGVHAYILAEDETLGQRLPQKELGAIGLLAINTVKELAKAVVDLTQEFATDEKSIMKLTNQVPSIGTRLNATCDKVRTAYLDAFKEASLQYRIQDPIMSPSKSNPVREQDKVAHVSLQGYEGGYAVKVLEEPKKANWVSNMTTNMNIMTGMMGDMEDTEPNQNYDMDSDEGGESNGENNEPQLNQQGGEAPAPDDDDPSSDSSDEGSNEPEDGDSVNSEESESESESGVEEQEEIIKEEEEEAEEDQNPNENLNETIDLVTESSEEPSGGDLLDNTSLLASEPPNDTAMMSISDGSDMVLPINATIDLTQSSGENMDVDEGAQMEEAQVLGEQRQEGQEQEVEEEPVFEPMALPIRELMLTPSLARLGDGFPSAQSPPRTPTFVTEAEIESEEEPLDQAATSGAQSKVGTGEILHHIHGDAWFARTLGEIPIDEAMTSLEERVECDVKVALMESKMKRTTDGRLHTVGDNRLVKSALLDDYEMEFTEEEYRCARLMFMTEAYTELYNQTLMQLTQNTGDEHRLAYVRQLFTLSKLLWEQRKEEVRCPQDWQRPTERIEDMWINVKRTLYLDPEGKMPCWNLESDAYMSYAQLALFERDVHFQLEGSEESGLLATQLTPGVLERADELMEIMLRIMGTQFTKFSDQSLAGKMTRNLGSMSDTIEHVEVKSLPERLQNLVINRRRGSETEPSSSKSVSRRTRLASRTRESSARAEVFRATEKEVMEAARVPMLRVGLPTYDRTLPALGEPECFSITAASRAFGRPSVMSKRAKSAKEMIVNHKHNQGILNEVVGATLQSIKEEVRLGVNKLRASESRLERLVRLAKYTRRTATTWAYQEATTRTQLVKPEDQTLWNHDVPVCSTRAAQLSPEYLATIEEIRREAEVLVREVDEEFILRGRKALGQEQHDVPKPSAFAHLAAGEPQKVPGTALGKIVQQMLFALYESAGVALKTYLTFDDSCTCRNADLACAAGDSVNMNCGICDQKFREAILMVRGIGIYFGNLTRHHQPAGQPEELDEVLLPRMLMEKKEMKLPGETPEGTAVGEFMDDTNLTRAELDLSTWYGTRPKLRALPLTVKKCWRCEVPFVDQSKPECPCNRGQGDDESDDSDNNEYMRKICAVTKGEKRRTQPHRVAHRRQDKPTTSSARTNESKAETVKDEEVGDLKQVADTFALVPSPTETSVLSLRGQVVTDEPERCVGVVGQPRTEEEQRACLQASMPPPPVATEIQSNQRPIRSIFFSDTVLDDTELNRKKVKLAVDPLKLTWKSDNTGDQLYKRHKRMDFGRGQEPMTVIEELEERVKEFGEIVSDCEGTKLRVEEKFKLGTFEIPPAREPLVSSKLSLEDWVQRMQLETTRIAAARVKERKRQAQAAEMQSQCYNDKDSELLEEQEKKMKQGADKQEKELTEKLWQCDEVLEDAVNQLGDAKSPVNKSNDAPMVTYLSPAELKELGKKLKQWADQLVARTEPGDVHVNFEEDIDKLSKRLIDWEQDLKDNKDNAKVKDLMWKWRQAPTRVVQRLEPGEQSKLEGMCSRLHYSRKPAKRKKEMALLNQYIVIVMAFGKHAREGRGLEEQIGAELMEELGSEILPWALEKYQKAVHEGKDNRDYAKSFLDRTPSGSKSWSPEPEQPSTSRGAWKLEVGMENYDDKGPDQIPFEEVCKKGQQLADEYFSEASKNKVDEQLLKEFGGKLGVEVEKHLTESLREWVLKTGDKKTAETIWTRFEKAEKAVSDYGPPSDPTQEQAYSQSLPVDPTLLGIIMENTEEEERQQFVKRQVLWQGSQYTRAEGHAGQCRTRECLWIAKYGFSGARLTDGERKGIVREKQEFMTKAQEERLKDSEEPPIHLPWSDEELIKIFTLRRNANCKRFVEKFDLVHARNPERLFRQQTGQNICACAGGCDQEHDKSESRWATGDQTTARGAIAYVVEDMQATVSTLSGKMRKLNDQVEQKLTYSITWRPQQDTGEFIRMPGASVRPNRHTWADTNSDGQEYSRNYCPIEFNGVVVPDKERVADGARREFIAAWQSAQKIGQLDYFRTRAWAATIGSFFGQQLFRTFAEYARRLGARNKKRFPYMLWTEKSAHLLELPDYIDDETSGFWHEFDEYEKMYGEWCEYYPTTIHMYREKVKLEGSEFEARDGIYVPDFDVDNPLNRDASKSEARMDEGGYSNLGAAAPDTHCMPTIDFCGTSKWFVTTLHSHVCRCILPKEEREVGEHGVSVRAVEAEQPLTEAERMFPQRLARTQCRGYASRLCQEMWRTGVDGSEQIVTVHADQPGSLLSGDKPGCSCNIPQKERDAGRSLRYASAADLAKRFLATRMAIEAQTRVIEGKIEEARKTEKKKPQRPKHKVKPTPVKRFKKKSEWVPPREKSPPPVASSSTDLKACRIQVEPKKVHQQAVAMNGLWDMSPTSCTDYDQFDMRGYYLLRSDLPYIRAFPKPRRLRVMTEEERRAAAVACEQGVARAVEREAVRGWGVKKQKATDKQRPEVQVELRAPPSQRAGRSTKNRGASKQSLWMISDDEAKTESCVVEQNGVFDEEEGTLDRVIAQFQAALGMNSFGGGESLVSVETIMMDYWRKFEQLGREANRQKDSALSEASLRIIFRMLLSPEMEEYHDRLQPEVGSEVPMTEELWNQMAEEQRLMMKSFIEAQKAIWTPIVTGDSDSSLDKEGVHEDSRVHYQAPEPYLLQALDLSSMIQLEEKVEVSRPMRSPFKLMTGMGIIVPPSAIKNVHRTIEAADLATPVRSSLRRLGFEIEEEGGLESGPRHSTPRPKVPPTDNEEVNSQSDEESGASGMDIDEEADVRPLFTIFKEVKRLPYTAQQMEEHGSRLVAYIRNNNQGKKESVIDYAERVAMVTGAAQHKAGPRLKGWQRVRDAFFDGLHTWIRFLVQDTINIGNCVIRTMTDLVMQAQRIERAFLPMDGTMGPPRVRLLEEETGLRERSGSSPGMMQAQELRRARRRARKFLTPSQPSHSRRNPFNRTSVGKKNRQLAFCMRATHRCIKIPMSINGNGICATVDTGCTSNFMDEIDIRGLRLVRFKRPIIPSIEVLSLNDTITIVDEYIHLICGFGHLKTYIRAVLRFLVSKTPLPVTGVLLGNQWNLRHGMAIVAELSPGYIEMPVYFSPQEGFRIYFLNEEHTTDSMRLCLEQLNEECAMPPPMTSEAWRYSFRPGIADIKALKYDALCSVAGPPVVKVVDGKQCELLRVLPPTFADTLPPVRPFEEVTELELVGLVEQFAQYVSEEPSTSSTPAPTVFTIDHSVPVWCANLWEQGCEFPDKE